MPLLPPDILQLTTTDGFITAFQNELSKHSKSIEAYEALEVKHEEVFARRRYSDFESFRRVMYRKMGTRGTSKPTTRTY